MTAQELSWYALWAATALYVIAMVAGSVHLARRADAKVAARASAARASAAVGARDAGDHPLPDDPVAVESAGTVDGAAPADLVRRRDRAAGIARAATVVGLALNLIGVVARAIEAAHVPWSNMYGYAITGALVAVSVLLIIQRRRDAAFLVPLVTGLAAIAIGMALRFLYTAATGLVPALQSFWLIVHVAIAILATGVFVVGFVATVLQLARDYADDTVREVDPALGRLRRLRVRTYNAVVRRTQSWRWLTAVPSAVSLEALAFRLHAVGFVMWTFTLISGAVWAEHAWGRYWGWDPKEVWTFVIWVIYAAYLHARTTQGWAGRRSAYLAVIGFVALIMNFTVVNFVFQGLHSYA